MKFFSCEEKEEKLLHTRKEFLNDLEYYILKILDGVIDDKFEVHINSASKVLFYLFKNFRQLFGYTQIWDNKYALETLQNKNWPYFIKTIIEISNDDVDLNSVTDQNKISIINETFENLNMPKEYYNSIYHKIVGCFQEYLNKIPIWYAKEFENNLKIHL